jgi:hypothetical protein
MRHVSERETTTVMVVGSVLEQHDPMIAMLAFDEAIRGERPPLTIRMNRPSTTSTKAGILVLLLLKYQTISSEAAAATPFVSATKQSGSSAVR